MNENYCVGKTKRIGRIINRKTKRTVIVPLDHSVTYGPIYGLNDLTLLIQQIENGGANAILGHRNIFYNIESLVNSSDISRILHISASTTLNNRKEDKRLISSVIDAIKIGADCVSMQIDVGNNVNNDFLENIGLISSECYEWGLPLLLMAYFNDNEVNKTSSEIIANATHIARICSDMGADIVKIQYPTSPTIFEKIINNCEIPVIIAGGEKMSSENELLSQIYESIIYGGSGVAIGRNIFQSSNPKILTEKIVKIVHNNYNIKEINEEYECI